MRRFVPFMLAGWLIGCVLVLLAFAVASHAGPVVKAPPLSPGMKLAPPTACTMNNRMDIFVSEDGEIWECSCEALTTSHICAWHLVGMADEERIRAKIAAGKLPKRFYYSARWHYIRTLYTRVAR